MEIVNSTFLISMLVLFVILINLGCSESKQHYKKGISYGNGGMYEKAIPEYTRSIELDPDYVDAYEIRGRTYYILDKYEEAIDDLTKAIELEPGFVQAHYYRGMAYYDISEYDMALIDFNAVIELIEVASTKTNSLLHLWHHGSYDFRGRIYYYKAECKKAIDEFSNAITIEPRCIYCHYNRGCSYLRNGEYDKAIADYNDYLDLAQGIYSNYAYSYIAYSHLYRGFCLAGLGQKNQAIADISKSLELNPSLSIEANEILEMIESEGSEYFVIPKLANWHRPR